MVNVAQKTYMAKAQDITRKCYVIDAKDKILGKVAVKAADLLRGKNKVVFTPHVDTGDMVIVVNADKVRLSGTKPQKKVYLRYSGYQSGQRSLTFDKMMEKKPQKVVELAVRRMIPSGPLGNQIYRKLKVYAGEVHPHISQKPIPVEIK